MVRTSCYVPKFAGKKTVKHTDNALLGRSIDRIIVHCSATVAGTDFRACDIDRCHRQRGFRCIGYHYVVRIDGSVEAGRHPSVIGAHCTGQNRHSIGVCYIGGLDKNGQPADTRTPAQRTALTELLRRLLRDYPGARIHGHRDYAAKACPCFDATAEYARLDAATDSVPAVPNPRYFQ